MENKSNDFYCQMPNETKNKTLCDVVNGRLKALCVKLVKCEKEDAEGFASALLKCGIKLVDGGNGSYGTSSNPAWNNDECAVVYNDCCDDFRANITHARSYYCKQDKKQNQTGQNECLILSPPHSPEITVKNGLSQFKKKKHFVVTAVNFVSEYKKTFANGTSVFVGFTFDVLNALAEYLNFDYEVHEQLDGHYGVQYENGSWSGMVGKLVRREVDIAVGTFSVTGPRAQVVDFTASFDHDKYGFIIKIPNEDRQSLYYKIFDEYTCYLLSLSIIVGALVMKFMNLNLLSTHDVAIKLSFNTYILHLYGYLVNQGNDQSPSKNAHRLFLFFFWVMTVTIVAVYSGNLLAFMTVTKIKLPINTIDELAEHPEYQAGVYEGGTLVDFFKFTKVGRKVWETNINVNPRNVPPPTPESTLAVINRVQTEKFVMLAPIGFQFLMLEKNSICDVTSGQPFAQSPTSFAVYKGFPYMEMFNARILAMVETGLVDKWRKAHLPIENKCDISFHSVNHSHTTVYETTGAYLILGTGISVSLLTFILEVLINHAKKQIHSLLRCMTRL